MKIYFILQILYTNKFGNIKLIKIRNKNYLYDYILVATNFNYNKKNIIKLFDKIKFIEINGDKNWLILIFDNLILHIMSKKNRLYYDIESIWIN